MQILITITVALYMLSTTKYLLFLFLQKKLYQKFGYILLIAGFGCHSAALIMKYAASGHIPVANLFQTLSFAAWTFVAVFFILQYKLRLKILGLYAAALASIIMVSASFFLNEPVQSLKIFNSVWLTFHILAIFAGEGALALACGIGILYLLQEYSIKNKQSRFFIRRLPSLELLDNTNYFCIITGFSMLTLGLVTGFIYAKAIWGTFWSWDPKEVWSGLSWILYAALLHGRLAVGWRGRNAAIMSIIGFLLLVFTFIGVNFWFQGHHGEFTQIKR
jgi:cytochrome c-type biogenesis protein CcsB